MHARLTLERVPLKIGALPGADELLAPLVPGKVIYSGNLEYDAVNFYPSRCRAAAIVAHRNADFALRYVARSKERTKMTTTAHGTTLTTITLNAPDPIALAHFYGTLLGWTIDSEDPGWVTLRNPEGGIGLAFQMEDIYVPPVWPAKAGEQQMMIHLEIRVDDLEAGCAHARACGATLADHQPQDDVRVHLDPAGHPFCLWIETDEA